MKIGFIGVGVMGKSMVYNLVKHGFEVEVYARNINKIKDVLDSGIPSRESIAELVKHNDVIITIVGYPSDVEEVYFAQNNIYDNVKSGQIVIDMTTSSPTLAKRIYERKKLNHQIKGEFVSINCATLRGDQALTYVQTRQNVGDNLNVSRMERQRNYMEGFAKAFAKQENADGNFVRSVYEQVAPYLVSDLPISTLSSMVDRCRNYTIHQVVSPEGKNVLGKEYYEFYADEEKLDKLVLELFYAPK